MAQASRKPRKRPSRARTPLPGWLWLLAGLGIGLGVAAYFYYEGRPARAPAATTAPAPAAPPPQPAAKNKDKDEGNETAEADKPRFDFYTILPEMEVVVPEAQKGNRAADKPGVYLLQVGSFRSFTEADALKAQLALLGVESKIETVGGKDQEVWHRVRVGPYSDAREINKIRTRLLNNNINAIMLQIKG